VLAMRASGSSIRVKNSEGTMLGAMLRDFGCKNIADSDNSLLENLSVESIALQDPDKIFFVQTGDDMESVKANVEAFMKEYPLWYELDAVKNGEVYFMEKRLYNMKPNALFFDAYKNLEEILYSEAQ
nr:ABC transporter substrate-binding protein [Oscillospiraceae bacterium]